VIHLEHIHLDARGCTHSADGIAIHPSQGAALLRVMGECLFCGHCGTDLPDLLHHTVFRCDGTAVVVTQRDFGQLHRCGDTDAITDAIDMLIDLTRSSTQ
jgi:hypothetical protein